RSPGWPRRRTRRAPARADRSTPTPGSRRPCGAPGRALPPPRRPAVARSRAPASAGERAPERHDPLRGPDVRGARGRALEDRVAAPGTRRIVGPVEDPVAVDPARFFEETLGGGERGGPDVAVGRGRDGAGGQAEP